MFLFLTETTSNVVETSNQLTVSDWIQVIGILTSFVLGLIAIWISLKTLKQNSKMIEESTRPVISIYSKYVDGILYIVTKNFGNSPCVIDYIHSDMQLTEAEQQGMTGNPYSNIINVNLPPQGSLISSFVPHRLKTKTYNFEVKYHSETRTYIDNFTVNWSAENPFADMHKSVNNIDAATCKISHTLEDILKTKL